MKLTLLLVLAAVYWGLMSLLLRAFEAAMLSVHRSNEAEVLT